MSKDVEKPLEERAIEKMNCCMCLLYAKPTLPAAIHVKIIQSLMSALTDVAEKNNFRGIASLSTNHIIAVRALAAFIFELFNQSLISFSNNVCNCEVYVT